MFTAGVNPIQVDTTPKYTLGSVHFVSSSAGTRGYIYVQASGAITGDSYICLVDGSDFTAVLATTAAAAPGTGTGKLAGVARAALANGEYGWLQIFGAGTIRVSASAAAYTRLNTTTTGGQANTDGGAGTRVLNGLALDVANGGTAGAVAGWINWPSVGVTL